MPVLHVLLGGEPQLDGEQLLAPLRGEHGQLGQTLLRAHGQAGDLRQRDVLLHVGLRGEYGQGSEVHLCFVATALFQLQVGLFEPSTRYTKVELYQAFFNPARPFYSVLKLFELLDFLVVGEEAGEYLLPPGLGLDGFLSFDPIVRGVKSFLSSLLGKNIKVCRSEGMGGIQLRKWVKGWKCRGKNQDKNKMGMGKNIKL